MPFARSRRSVVSVSLLPTLGQSGLDGNRCAIAALSKGRPDLGAPVPSANVRWRCGSRWRAPEGEPRPAATPASSNFKVARHLAENIAAIGQLSTDSRLAARD